MTVSTSRMFIALTLMSFCLFALITSATPQLVVSAQVRDSKQLGSQKLAFTRTRSQSFSPQFNSDFPSGLAGWSSIYGRWIVNRGNYVGNVNYLPFNSSKLYIYSAARKSENHADFTYTVRLYRNGNDNGSYGILVRGDAISTVRTAYGYTYTGFWKNAISLLITNSGSYAFYKIRPDTVLPLKSWTKCGCVKNGFNVLKVITRGYNYYFYINNTYVGAMTDLTYRTGKVGVMSFHYKQKHTLSVDYARLTKD
jgi:hypothetical protein